MGMNVMAAKDCLKNARVTLGLSQPEFAKLIGTTTTSVCLWETGQNIPQFKSIRKIVDVLKKEGIQIEYTDLRDE